MAKILLVEDDHPLRVVIENLLLDNHHTVDSAEDGQYALQLLLDYSYDAAIIDWDIPLVPGIEVCKAYRNKGGKTPVLFLTGRTDFKSRVTGLDSGADDYLCKPFNHEELLARLRALLRRHAGQQENLLTVGSIAYNIQSREVFFEGRPIELTRKEIAILEFFMRNPNHAFSIEAIVERVWSSESEVSPETVRPYIKKLRERLTHQDGSCPLVTVHGSGYKLIKE
jgi:two-component system, OmpR family, response regulator PhoP